MDRDNSNLSAIHSRVGMPSDTFTPRHFRREIIEHRSGPADLLARYREIRATSVRLTAGLSPEDCLVQTMPDVSPAKWHLAHTTWFFETFVLDRISPESAPTKPQFRVLFNSYYNAVGEQFPRSRRGTISRPTHAEVCEYRGQVDDAMEHLLGGECNLDARTAEIIELGLHHEQQHQELILTDVKHVFWSNPLRPPLINGEPTPPGSPALNPSEWIAFEGGVREIGDGGGGFAFDNERPRHEVYVHPYQFASRLVTNGEYLEFIEAGGYRRPELWLSDGWDAVQAHGWSAPLYWARDGGAWRQFTLSGMRPLQLSEPVCHVSLYEADAFARFSGARLPTETEWENAAAEQPLRGNFADSGRLHPATNVPVPGSAMQQLFGDVWEWTSSPYTAYPGYQPSAGALGEYNGKFMCNQFVLRGGSCATPPGHVRCTYRNFFPAEKRWQFTGIRLAKDI